ncbi:Spo0B C-terminal domain-containing protein [Neobacillus fumarioli]|uniref:Spo0B C-terminal domain-containing protein n=1 Tax=Neobacillus fumarioli TaxID=105229 RepID=UPI000834CA42|nr:Spo0B C-terminal domain-containing protein [Neobacillus fumarioli]
MKKEWDMIEVLRHSRHDWLNRLQLIKGNLDLDRIDRAKSVIDEIVIEALQETKLSNLPMPQFASLLLKANWNENAFRLEYEVLEDQEAFNIQDEVLADWTKNFFISLNQAIEIFHENHLFITIAPQAEGIRFFFDFNGIIINKKPIEKFLAEQKDMVIVTVRGFFENELALEVFMPFL